MDVDAIDVVDGSRSLPAVRVQPASRHVVYVTRSLYDADVRAGQETTIAAYAQLGRDIARCAFTMDGAPTSKIPSALSTRLIRYCTQAVMAAPVEMLTSERVVVRESRRRMRVAASRSNVAVTKALVCMSCCMAHQTPVEVRVRVDLRDPLVEVVFEFGRTASESSSRESPPSHVGRHGHHLRLDDQDAPTADEEHVRCDK